MDFLRGAFNCTNSNWQIKIGVIMDQKTLNIITNIIGFLLFILEPVRAYLEQNDFNIWTFMLALGTAVVAYFSNKEKVGT